MSDYWKYELRISRVLNSEFSNAANMCKWITLMSKITSNLTEYRKCKRGKIRKYYFGGRMNYNGEINVQISHNLECFPDSFKALFT